MKMVECSFPIRYYEKDLGDDWSARAVDRVCMDHVAASKYVSKGCKSMGLATDVFWQRH